MCRAVRRNPRSDTSAIRRDLRAPLLLLLASASAGIAAGEASPPPKRDFPFLTACIGAPSPAKNVAMKGIAIRLDHDASVCFDTDLLRMSAGWTGAFLNFKGVLFNGEFNIHPTTAGDLKFGTPTVPGCVREGQAFADPRPEPYGPLPAALGRWNGLHVRGDSVVLSYTVGGTRILEEPACVVADGLTTFVRSFRVESVKAPLALLVCEVERGTGRVEKGVAQLAAADGSVTVVGLAGAPAGARLEVAASRIVLKLAGASSPATFGVVLWRGPKADAPRFANVLKEVKPAVADVARAGPPHWPRALPARGARGADNGPYAVDEIPPPEGNPWNRRVRFSGLDFFSDGRAALCTWDGDVWLASGIDDALEKVEWRLFASGLFEPLGLKIVDNVVHVAGRDQITRLRDLDGDGEADDYENFNNQCTATENFHEFVYDLQTDKEGNFYYTKGAAVTDKGNGFQENASMNGTMLKVSKDGSKLEVYATGFRAPNGMGVGPAGEITSSDNQGCWVPACPIHWIVKGGFYGVEVVAHRKPIPEPNPPICWLSWKDTDNSGGGQVWVTSDRWGPFKGELLHLSYGKCALYLVMRQKAGALVQGGVVRLPADFSSGVMRGRFHPRDGQLYVTGLQGWQTSAAKLACFERVRYTGKPIYTASKLSVAHGAVQLAFTQPLDPREASDPQNYSIEQWNYRRTAGYGSPDFSVRDPQKEGRDDVPLSAARLSGDGKTLTLAVPSLRPVMQMRIQYKLKAKDGTPVKQDVMLTIHAVP